MYRDKIGRALSFDPRKAARDAGARNPGRLASALASDNQARLRAMLQETGDSYLGQPFDEFIKLAEQLGFTLIQDEDGFNNGETRFTVLEKRGRLLITDSYQGMVNQAYLVGRGQADSVRQGLKYSIYDLPQVEEPLDYSKDMLLLPRELSQRADPRAWPADIVRQLKAGN